MKKLFLIIILKILFISSSYSQIIYRNCNLEPNYDKGAEIHIDLESKIIKVVSPNERGVVVHTIDKAFGTVLISSNIKHSSNMPADFLKFFTDNASVEMTLDIENHLVSLIVDTKQNASNEFKKFIEENVEKGELLTSIQDTCDVENNYDPMREKKLLKEISSSNISTNSIIKFEEENINKLTDAEMSQLMKKIYSCWSIPLGLPSNVDKTFKINLQFKEDGSIISAEHTAEDKIKMQSSGQSNFKVLAQSGMRAIKLCAPYNLPKDKYEAWKNITINFKAV